MPNFKIRVAEADAERVRELKAELGGTWDETFMEMVAVCERLAEERDADHKSLPTVLEERLEDADDAGR